jgi:hypothetical protein
MAQNLPLQGSSKAPKFDGTTTLLISYIDDVESLIAAANIADDAQKIKIALRFADEDEAEGWRLLAQATAQPADWATFIQALKDLYPGCEDGCRYGLLDLQYLVHENHTKVMRNRSELGDYHRNFRKMAKPLVAARMISDLSVDEWFLDGFHPDFARQVRARVISTDNTLHPFAVLKIEDVMKAAMFLLTRASLLPCGSAGRTPSGVPSPAYSVPSHNPSTSTSTSIPFTAPPSRSNPTGIPSHVAPSPQLPQTVKHETFSASRWNCNFCGELGHYIGSCTKVEAYIAAGKAT